MAAIENSTRPSNDAHIRVAAAADVESLVTLINAAFVVEQIAIEGDRVDRIGVEKYMLSGRFLMLEDDEALLGCVYMEKRGDRGYLGLLAVAPERQGRGIGRLLAEQAEKRFQEESCSAVDLRVISARAELVAFYEKLGYEVAGTSAMPDSVPLKMPCHYIHMSKSLQT